MWHTLSKKEHLPKQSYESGFHECRCPRANNDHSSSSITVSQEWTQTSKHEGSLTLLDLAGQLRLINFCRHGLVLRLRGPSSFLLSSGTQGPRQQHEDCSSQLRRREARVDVNLCFDHFVGACTSMFVYALHFWRLQSPNQSW